MRAAWPIAITAALAVIVAGGYLWATGGSPDRVAPGWITDTPFAHRGLADTPERPENSLAAFRAAVDAGVAIELDVHITADGRAVVVHDDDLERLAGDPREVAQVTLAEMRGMRILGTTESFPTLAEALDVIDGRVAVLVEVKNRGDVGPLEDAVARDLAGYHGDVAVMSFNPYTVGRFAEVAPELPRGQLSGSFAGEDLPGWQVFALRNLLMNWSSRPDFIAYELSELPTLDTRIQRMKGRPLLAWTAETPADYQRALDLADNAICDPGALP